LFTNLRQRKIYRNDPLQLDNSKAAVLQLLSDDAAGLLADIPQLSNTSSLEMMGSMGLVFAKARTLLLRAESDFFTWIPMAMRASLLLQSSKYQMQALLSSF
jgi:hypothetical protein